MARRLIACSFKDSRQEKTIANAGTALFTVLITDDVDLHTHTHSTLIERNKTQLVLSFLLLLSSLRLCCQWFKQMRNSAVSICLEDLECQHPMRCHFFIRLCLGLIRSSASSLNSNNICSLLCFPFFFLFHSVVSLPCCCCDDEKKGRQVPRPGPCIHLSRWDVFSFFPSFFFLLRSVIERTQSGNNSCRKERTNKKKKIHFKVFLSFLSLQSFFNWREIHRLGRCSRISVKAAAIQSPLLFLNKKSWATASEV